MIRRNVHFLSALVVLACVGWTPRGHANWSPDTVLSDASASFLGEEGDAGISVSADGDLDGDGFDDILISAPPYSQVVAGGGKLYVVFGHASGWAMDTPLSQADSSFLSLTPDGNLGSHATIVGDVNGDGFDDFLASEPGCHERAGCAYLVLGKAAGWVLDVTIDNADAWFVGENPYDTVATVGDVGDVDGDGFDDFLVGAEYSSEAGSGAGQVYLFSGGQQGWAPETSLAAADASFLPEHAEDYLSALRGRGDVDGDGFNDLLLGADGADAGENNTGESYLLLGNAGGWSMDSSLATADASFVGQGSPADHSDQSGFSGCLGDVTGDGLADVVVSAFGHENPDGSSGRVYVVPGMARGWQMDQPLGSAAVVLEGEEPEDHFGSHLACLEDVNGDGIGDLLVGAFMNSENGEEAGQTYLYLGGDDL
ncbi:MAG: integrin alpha, partial [Myxococcota bacterium]|nr:integrin alpha [Myxococcota bacterium]